MRRVLIVAPAFPPHPSPATHRARFLAMYGAPSGYEVEVLSVDPSSYEEPLDYELAQLVPSSLPVTRVPALPARMTRVFGVGDLGIRAYLPLRRALFRLCQARRPDIVFFPAPPWHTFLLGPAIQRAFGIPYVLDYTDPWVFKLAARDQHPWRKAYWFQRLALALEPMAVRGAAQLLAVSDGTHAGLRRRYPEIPDARYAAIPFGFEPNDFAELRRRPRPNPLWQKNDGRIHLVYLGAMLPHALGTLRSVLTAVRLLVERQPDLAENVAIHFVGTTYDPNAREGLVAPVALEIGLGAMVVEHPRRLPYMDALNVLSSASGILALGSDEPHYTPSKIFPNLLAGPPVVAVYHERSTICDIVRRWGGTELVTFSEHSPVAHRTEQIATALARAITGRTSPPSAERAALIAEFSAERCTQKVCAVLDRAVRGARRHNAAEVGDR